MISELIRFNCHILDTNQHPDNITPEILLEQYKAKTDWVLEGVQIEIVSCNWAANSKTSILTKVKRKD